MFGIPITEPTQLIVTVRVWWIILHWWLRHLL